MNTESAPTAPQSGARPLSPLVQAAMAAHERGDELTAVASLTVALQQDGADTAAQLLRGQVLAAMGQWREAAADAEAVLAHRPDNAEALLLLAAARAATGATGPATDALHTLLQEHPDHRPAILLLGRLYAANGHADLALQLYDRAIAALPDFAEAYHARGGVKHQLHDEAGAAEDLQHALELSPELARSFDGSYSLLDNSLKAPASCLHKR